MNKDQVALMEAVNKNYPKVELQNVKDFVSWEIHDAFRYMGRDAVLDFHPTDTLRHYGLGPEFADTLFDLAME